MELNKLTLQMKTAGCRDRWLKNWNWCSGDPAEKGK